MRIQVLDEAEDDLQSGREFYDRQAPGVGGYFAAALAADIDSLILFAGIHSMEFGFHRALSRDDSRLEFTTWLRERLSASTQFSTCAAIPHGFAVG